MKYYLSPTAVEGISQKKREERERLVACYFKNRTAVPAGRANPRKDHVICLFDQGAPGERMDVRLKIK